MLNDGINVNEKNNKIFSLEVCLYFVEIDDDIFNSEHARTLKLFNC
jgi:hypothetical protein